MFVQGQAVKHPSLMRLLEFAQDIGIQTGRSVAQSSVVTWTSVSDCECLEFLQAFAQVLFAMRQSARVLHSSCGKRPWRFWMWRRKGSLAGQSSGRFCPARGVLEGARIPHGKNIGKDV